MLGSHRLVDLRWPTTAVNLPGMSTDETPPEPGIYPYTEWARLKELREAVRPTKSELEYRWGVRGDTKGLTQSEAARRSGMSPQRWNNIERGQRKPSEANLEAMARALGVTIEDLGEPPVVPPRSRRREPRLRPNAGRPTAGEAA